MFHDLTMDFEILEKNLGLSFRDKNLLTQAFTHRSYLNENPDFGLEHNERLEFLGDAVIELIVTDYLYKEYPKKPEGELTNWRAALVNAKMLTKIADKIGLNDFLLLSKGEAREGGKARAYILANTFEALLGALYLDSGYEAADKFLKKYLLKELQDIIEDGSYKDSKSKFQEEAQEKVSITPVYKVLNESGPDHAKLFVVGVFLEEELVAEGEGLSKQEAEEAAARKGLEVKNWE
ncbi:MAG: ribonuclease III [bacterium]